VKEQYHKWFSEYLSREFELLVFGQDGYPVVLFPSSKGRYYENKDCGLIDSVAHLLDSGKIKIYCPDGADSSSWYNYSIHPSDRVKTHIGYEKLILNDVIEFARHETGQKKVALAGCDFGAYHAANLGFRHPDIVNSIICMGGFYDIKQFIYGYYDDNCYFNNPPDYLPNLNDNWYLDKFRQMTIILGTGENDESKNENIRLSNILNSKEIPHLLDIRSYAGHDWHSWREMFPQYMEKINGKN
jgi:esterase/lipase superfamily enzyme